MTKKLACLKARQSEYEYSFHQLPAQRPWEGFPSLYVPIARDSKSLRAPCMLPSIQFLLTLVRSHWTEVLDRMKFSSRMNTSHFWCWTLKKILTLRYSLLLIQSFWKLCRSMTSQSVGGSISLLLWVFLYSITAFHPAPFYWVTP